MATLDQLMNIKVRSGRGIYSDRRVGGSQSGYGYAEGSSGDDRSVLQHRQYHVQYVSQGIFAHVYEHELAAAEVLGLRRRRHGSVRGRREGRVCEDRRGRFQSTLQATG